MLKMLQRPGPGPVRLVTDLWTVVHEIQHVPQVNERLLRLPEETHQALTFRTYAVATVAGRVTLGSQALLLSGPLE